MKIKLVAKILLIILITSACQSNRTATSTDQTDSITNVGGIRDANGCLKSAGYVWSQVLKKCVRPFDEGIALEILNTSESYQTAAFVLMDSLQKSAEVFVPDEDKSLILDLKNDTLYSNGKFNLTKENFCWTLSLNKIKLFQERK